MLAARSGSIVNIASIAGLRGVSHRAAYNASKHGLVGLTSTLAAEWGGRGVRVNAVCPGWIKTEMDDEDQAAGGYTDDDITGQVPLARFAAPERRRRGGHLPRRPRPERLRQRRRAARRRRLDVGRELAQPSPSYPGWLTVLSPSS